MKNYDKRALAFGQYINNNILLCYKQPVSIYNGKFNNVGKTDEDPTWSGLNLKRPYDYHWHVA